MNGSLNFLSTTGRPFGLHCLDFDQECIQQSIMDTVVPLLIMHSFNWVYVEIFGQVTSFLEKEPAPPGGDYNKHECKSMSMHNTCMDIRGRFNM